MPGAVQQLSKVLRKKVVLHNLIKLAVSAKQIKSFNQYVSIVRNVYALQNK